MKKIILLSLISGSLFANADLYNKCVACHGINGEIPALGKSAVLKGQTKKELFTKLKGYKAGEINLTGMGSLMKGQVAIMEDKDFESLAEYISNFK